MVNLNFLERIIAESQKQKELEAERLLVNSKPPMTTEENLLESFLKKGYFPAELPPPFSTYKYSKELIKHKENLKPPFTIPARGPNYISKPIKFNISRRGSLRRKLSIPNPVNHYQMSSILSENWKEISSFFHEAEKTLSKPVFGKKRCLEWEKGFNCLPEVSLETRNASRYILRSDISNFYPTIYTHSIAWALHTKAVAKRKRYYKNNLGNKLDRIIQNSQDGQTKGIPISTDSSFIIGEIISVAIDIELQKNGIEKYHRYIDDYEFGCSTYQVAELTLSKLQEILESFELSLNPNKTSIVELPLEINPCWVKELSDFKFSENCKFQKRDLYNFFDVTVRAHRLSKDEAVIQYALTKIIHLEVAKENWGAYQNILLQWAIIEPSTLHYIIDVLLIYRKNKYPLNEEGLQNTFITIIKENSSIGHIGEVSWAIWACILFEINISSVAILLSNIENPIIALLTLDAKNKNLIDDNYDFSLWKTLMIKEELKSENWLLAYEAYINNWLPSVSGVDYIKNSDGFDFFQENDVHFYNCNLSSIYEPDIQAFKIEEMNQYTSGYR